MLTTKIKNDKGEFIILNDQEVAVAGMNQRKFDAEYRNALGFELDITTLTAISKRITEQKFFEIAPADYLPVRVGDGAWSTELLTYLDFSVAGDFEQGIVNTAANDARLAEASAGIKGIQVPIIPWAKQITWSLFDLRYAMQSGNWDVVTSKERARKKNWDLGVQRTSFLGLASDTRVLGLLTQPDVTVNTTLITEFISSMDPTEFAVFVQGIIAAYRANSNYTAMPTHFAIPELDYNGLVAPVSPTFPVNSKLEYLQKAFAEATRNKNFKILPLAYAGVGQNADVVGLNKNRYSLYNYDEDSLRMDIPVDYTATLQNTLNNFQFQNVGFGQFTGAKAYRPLEMLYFDIT